MFRKNLIAFSLAAVIACGAVTPAMAMESGAEAGTIETTETTVVAEEEADGPENEGAEEMTAAAEEAQEADPEEGAADSSLEGSFAEAAGEMDCPA